MEMSKVVFAVISVIMIIAFVFVGFELGKMYSARNVVTQAIRDIDPFIFCNLHVDNLIKYNFTRSEFTEEDMENYAQDLYLQMSQNWRQEKDEMTDMCKDMEDPEACCFIRGYRWSGVECV